MSLLVIAIVAVVAIALIVAFALVSVALAADRADPEIGLFTVLEKHRGPSGQPFFPNRQAMEDFVDTLDAVRDDMRGAAGR